MEVVISVSKLEELLSAYRYTLDLSQEKPIFWRRLNPNDLRSPFAFSLVMITLDDYSLVIEGINEPRIKRAIDAGVIEVTTPEDFEVLKEVVFETTLENDRKLKTVLPFFEEQLNTLEAYPIYSDEYKRAIANIQLLVEAANEIEW